MITAIQNLLNVWAEAFDLPILEWIQANIANPFLDFIMPWITLLGDAGIFWILCAIVLLFIPKYRKVGLGMGIAMAMGLLICNVIMKPIIARPRPYDYQFEHFAKEIILLIEAQHDYSFPSGHTIASFEAATVLLMNSKKMGIPAYILAILIAFSRLYLYVHYPTDVIASIILGTLFALIGNGLAAVIAPKLRFGKRGKYEAR